MIALICKKRLNDTGVRCATELPKRNKVCPPWAWLLLKLHKLTKGT